MANYQDLPSRPFRDSQDLIQASQRSLTAWPVAQTCALLCHLKYPGSSWGHTQGMPSYTILTLHGSQLSHQARLVGELECYISPPIKILSGLYGAKRTAYHPIYEWLRSLLNCDISQSQEELGVKLPVHQCTLVSNQDRVIINHHKNPRSS